MHCQLSPFRMLHLQAWYSLSHSVPRMYADDSYLAYSNGNIHSAQSSLKEDLLNINRWLTINKLTLNMAKSEFMLIGSREKLNNLPSLPSLNINNIPIKHSHCSKPSGVLTDKNSTWENHGDALFKKIASSIGAVKRILIIVCPLLPRVMYIVALSNHTLTIAAWYGVTVLKLCVINCSNSRTVWHVFSQTPIMMHVRVYF